MMKWAVYAALGAIIIAGGWYALHEADARGYARAQAEYDVRALAATTTARETERKLQDALDTEAKNHANDVKVTQGTIDTLASAADQLRRQLAASEQRRPGQTTGATARNVAADTLTRQFFSECITEYQKMAGAADHLADGFRITARWGFIVDGARK